MKNIPSKLVYLGLALLLIFTVLSIISNNSILYRNKSSSDKSASSKNTDKQSLLSKEVEKKEKNPCGTSEQIIQTFLKKINFKLEATKKIQNLLLHDEAINKLIIKNDKCGAGTASRLANIYSSIGLTDKALDYHNKVLDFAQKNNLDAIENLCGYDSLATQAQQRHFCNIVLDNKNISFKSSAIHFLGGLYFDQNEGDKLINLCMKSGGMMEVCFFSNLFPSVSLLAKKLMEEKNDKLALKLYEIIAPHDVDGFGFTQIQLGDMYFYGQGTEVNYVTAISWYQKALEKNYDDETRSSIMNNMCLAYIRQYDYVSAFKYCEQAAKMGLSVSQVNLAQQYLHGYGTLQDYKKAYAWISIAIAQGVEGRKKQDRAEKIKKWITYHLREQDKTGEALNQANRLAKKYYKLYVPHKKRLTQ